MAVSEYTTEATAPVLIVAAHPDDAVLGAGVWAATWPGAVTVAFLTDGVPAERCYFAPGFTDPDHYRRTRRQEARQAWRELRPGAELHFGAIADQSLAFQLPAAGMWLQRILDRVQPARVLVPAFEGGHPDHDAANRLVAFHAAQLEVWEYALYSMWHGTMLRQSFPGGAGQQSAPTAANACKCRALAAYHSQQATLATLAAGTEAQRPLPRHDYARPARAEACVYERWGWPWTALDIARALTAYPAPYPA